jgi:hypothetical protein
MGGTSENEASCDQNAMFFAAQKTLAWDDVESGVVCREG